MRGRRPIAVCCALAMSLAWSTAAHASPDADSAAVFEAWTDNGFIPHCRFAEKQLLNAKERARAIDDFTYYSPGFAGSVDVELAFIHGGGCRGVARPPSHRKRAKSAVGKAKLGKIRPRGHESVVVTNTSRRAISLTGATLRDRSGHKVRLRGALSGRGSRRIYSRGVWDNRGDVVKLADRKGLVVRQTGFGSWDGVVRF